MPLADKATLVRDKAAFQKHWTPDLDVWFENGIDTPGLVLVQVHANRIKVWDKNNARESWSFSAVVIQPK